MPTLRFFAQLRGSLSAAKKEWKRRAMQERFFKYQNGADAELDDYTIQITEGHDAYMQYKDEFMQAIYRFNASTPSPFIIDGGSNVGISILYFKRLYPRARIIGFEPDPYVFEILQKNLNRNGIDDVVLVKAGLGFHEGKAPFRSDMKSGGRITTESTSSVQTVPLSRYLTEPVDFLKLNIEGQELPVLKEVEASGKLQNIREMVLEYHGWSDSEQLLGKILNLLDRNGFRYLVHDFDEETCPQTKPPFRFRENLPWFCLVYARRGEPVENAC